MSFKGKTVFPSRMSQSRRNLKWIQFQRMHTAIRTNRVELNLPPGTYRLVADPPRESDLVRTIAELVVKAEKGEQSSEVQMINGCVLIVEAVDASSGTGVSNVSFWETFEDGVWRGRRGVQSSTV